MRLLFVTGSLVHGGAERHTVGLASRLAARGHECHLAYVKDDPSQLGRLRGAASARCLHARAYLDPAALGRLALGLERLEPDVIFAVNAYGLLYARLAAWRSRLRVPLAVTFHTTRLRSAREELQMLYYRPLFWSASVLVFVCEAQRRHWRRRLLWGRRTAVIHNGVDLERWRPRPAAEVAAARQALGIAAGDFVVGMSAVLRPEKNPLQLVEAAASLRRRGIPARLLFIGDGPMRPAIEARAAALGIAPAVALTGLREEVRPLLGACDAVALCSTSETFSLAGLEAMALGRPVVHAEVGGAAEMIEPGETGLLFPVGDTEALAGRLAQLADPQLRRRLGEAARRTVEARFSEAAMVERYERLASELEAKRRKRGRIRKPAGAH